jgi:hypothetical protein
MKSPLKNTELVKKRKARDWKRVSGTFTYRREKSPRAEIRAERKRDSSEYIVALDYFDSDGWYFRNNQFIKSFKTKTSALAYARAYMRKH